MQTRIRSLLLLALLLVLSSCATARRGPAAGQAETTIEVQNQHFLDMRIYVLRSGQRVRLGMVPGLSTRVLVIPPGLVFGATSLSFYADPVGGRATPISQEITVSPGDQVQMVIPNY